MDKLALLIGVSQYEKGFSALPAAAKDVEAMQKVLEDQKIGGFKVTSLINKDRQLIDEEIEQLFSDRKKDDLLVLFFSGHGMKDENGKLFLAARNTRKLQNGELSRATAISASSIQAAIHSCHCKRIVVILDCCFSGAFPAGMNVKDDGSVPIAQQLGGEGWAVLTSSTSTQYSLESQGFALSVYTHFLVEGIRTGSADRDQDGTISVEELHDYVKEKVLETVPGKMTPEIYSPTEGRKIVLARVPDSNRELLNPRKLKQKQSWGQIFSQSPVVKKAVTAAIAAIGMGLLGSAGVFLVSHDWRSLTGIKLPTEEKNTPSLNATPTFTPRQPSQTSRSPKVDLEPSSKKSKVTTTANSQSSELPKTSSGKLDTLSFKDNSTITEGEYKQLESLLITEQWKAADLKTSAILHKVADQELGGWYVDTLGKFPCNDLQIINKVWEKYSSGKFGFSVQAQIWTSIGGKSSDEIGGELATLDAVIKWEKNFDEFNTLVGWLVGSHRLKHHELTFSINGPRGHLPAYVWGVGRHNLMADSGEGKFFSRIKSCRL